MPPHSARPPPAFGPGPPPPSMQGPYGAVVPPPMPVPVMPGMNLTRPPNSVGVGAQVGGGGAMAAVVGGALPDKMNTLFIGSIAPGINNVAMEKLLKTTGNLTKWKRVQDPTTQQWKAFGFAEYADADSLLRTLRVLGQDGQQPKGEKPVGLELKAMDGSDVVKALLVKADEKTRQFLDQYEESRPRTIHDTEKDKVALANATKVIQQMKDGTLDTSDAATAAGSDDATNDASSSNRDDLTPRSRRRDNLDSSKAVGEDGGAEDDISDEQKELIAREINFFRERAALKEKERKEEEERLERMSSRSGHHHHHRQSKDSSSAATGANASTSTSHRAGRERAWGGSSSSGAGGSSRQMDFVSASGANHVEAGSSHSPALTSTSSTGATGGASGSQDQDAGMDSEEEEKARQERREREIEHTFKERERRWEQREVERMRLYEKDKARDADYEAESHAARDAMGARFAQWNDDVERERRHEDYYRDRSRWWHRRQAFLVKEQRYDELDREEEKEELAEAAKKAAQEAEAALSAAAAAVAEISSTAMDVDATVASALTEAGQDKDVEMNEASGSGSISNTNVTTDAADGNDSAVTTTAAELNIPSDPQELWNWPIQWSFMDENEGQLLKEKILPFANKIVVELLGVPEETLTKYLVDHIRQRKPPQDLVSELRGALDNDADVLVARVWKVLIQETESCARKQQQ
ncbi:hypothetical protein BGW39_011762 [Mortierella sp. 14UC]|nr:hypothetical protein BGW39_011762 [Mortierella sp. 14UC]